MAIRTGLSDGHFFVIWPEQSGKKREKEYPFFG
jgi:hypothetical protein